MNVIPGVLLVMYFMVTFEVYETNGFNYPAQYYYYTRKLSYRMTAEPSRYRYSASFARYKRVYSSTRLGQFYWYYAIYSRHSRLSSYTSRNYRVFSDDCKNFEANSQGDYMGYFQCPMQFEPLNFTRCCGLDSYQYCCPKKSEPETDWSLPVSVIIRIAIGVALPVGGLLVAAVVGCCILYHRSKQRRTTAQTTVHQNTMAYNSYPTGVVNPASADAPPPYSVAVPYGNCDDGQPSPYPKQPMMSVVYHAPSAPPLQGNVNPNAPYM